MFPTLRENSSRSLTIQITTHLSLSGGRPNADHHTVATRKRVGFASGGWWRRGRDLFRVSQAAPAGKRCGMAKRLRTACWFCRTDFLQTSRMVRSRPELFSDSNASLGAAAVCGGGRSIVVSCAGVRAGIGESLADGRRRLESETPYGGRRSFCRFALRRQWVYTPTERQRWMRVPLEGGKSEVLPSTGVPGSAPFPSPAFPGMTGCWLPMVLVPDSATNAYKNRLAVIKTNSMDAPFRILDADSRHCYRQ